MTPRLIHSIMSFYGQRLDHIIYVEKSIIVDAKKHTQSNGRFAFYEESGFFLQSQEFRPEKNYLSMEKLNLRGAIS